jgi:1-deoxy-D-xylulose-5-phosphate reductoisomerase
VAGGHLTFEPVDLPRFPVFRLGVEAGRIGNTAPAVFNAANEVAVAGFLAGRLPFHEMGGVIEAALTAQGAVPIESLDTVLGADREARAVAAEAMRTRTC